MESMLSSNLGKAENAARRIQSSMMPHKNPYSGIREGLSFIRIQMVLGCMTPLFLFLMIRGVPVIDGKPIFPDKIYMAICGGLILIPNAFLRLRIFVSRRNQDTKELVVGTSTDHRDYLIAYLFALVIPLYQNNYNNLRDVFAALTLLSVILFLFFHMNLHYMNLIFAFFGYRLYTVETDTHNPFSGRSSFILITKRRDLHSQQKITAFRLSDNVFIE